MTDKNQNISIHPADLQSELVLPYADGGIQAGFPNIAQDYLEQAIDLNKELICGVTTSLDSFLKAIVTPDPD